MQDIRYYAKVGIYDKYFSDYAKEQYEKAEKKTDILAVWPLGYPHQRVKETILDRSYDTSFIYCYGNVNGKERMFYVEVDAPVNNKRIRDAIKEHLKRKNINISIHVMDKPDQETRDYINEQIRINEEWYAKHHKRW